MPVEQSHVIEPGKDELQLIDLDRAFLAVDVCADDEFTLAGKIAHALASVIKAYRCYAPEHQLHRDFEGKLFALLTLYLQCFDTLALQVGECDFSSQGRTMYAAGDIKSSIPFLLYRDGIRELHFLPGLGEDELRAFLTAIRQRDAVNTLEDDLVTLLWEKELPHLEVLAVDNFLNGIDPFLWDSLEAFRAHRASEPQLALSVAGEGWATPDPDALDALPCLLTNRELYRLTPEDRQTLQHEVQQATAADAPLGAADVLFDMLPLAPDPITATLEANLLRRLLGEMFEVGSLHRAAGVLQRIGACVTTSGWPAWQLAPLRQVLDGVSPAQWCELLAALVRGGKGDAGQVAEVILLQPAATMPAVCALLDDAGAGPARRLLDAALLAVGRANPELILQVLEQPPRDHLAEFVRLAGELDVKRAVPYLGRALDRRDPKIRLAAVAALGKIGGSQALHLIARALQDHDETVRCRAAVILGGAGDDIALHALLPVAAAAEFGRRSPVEMRTVLTALGACPQAQAGELLQRLAQPGSLFRRGAPPAVRACAQQVLAASRAGTGTPASDTPARAYPAPGTPRRTANGA